MAVKAWLLSRWSLWLRVGGFGTTCREGPWTKYLRIIYGPEYTLRENLLRLKSRGLGAKRSLALREFALGLEALERFVHQTTPPSSRVCFWSACAGERTSRPEAVISAGMASGPASWAHVHAGSPPARATNPLSAASLARVAGSCYLRRRFGGFIIRPNTVVPPHAVRDIVIV